MIFTQKTLKYIKEDRSGIVDKPINDDKIQEVIDYLTGVNNSLIKMGNNLDKAHAMLNAAGGNSNAMFEYNKMLVQTKQLMQEVRTAPAAEGGLVQVILALGKLKKS